MASKKSATATHRTFGFFHQSAAKKSTAYGLAFAPASGSLLERLRTTPAGLG